jgi:hypothetical protein
MEYTINHANNEKWRELFAKARYHFKIADHMAYVTLTLLKENRLIIKILNETAEAASFLINSILRKEHAEGKSRIYQDSGENLRNFVEKIAPKYIVREDVANLISLLEIRKKHIESHSEFVRKDKFVILIGDKYEVLTIEKVKEFMNSTRRLMARFEIGLG